MLPGASAPSRVFGRVKSQGPQWPNAEAVPLAVYNLQAQRLDLCDEGKHLLEGISKSTRLGVLFVSGSDITSRDALLRHLRHGTGGSEGTASSSGDAAGSGDAAPCQPVTCPAAQGQPCLWVWHEVVTLMRDVAPGSPPVGPETVVVLGIDPGQQHLQQLLQQQQAAGLSSPRTPRASSGSLDAASSVDASAAVARLGRLAVLHLSALALLLSSSVLHCVEQQLSVGTLDELSMLAVALQTVYPDDIDGRDSPGLSVLLEHGIGRAVAAVAAAQAQQRALREQEAAAAAAASAAAASRTMTPVNRFASSPIPIGQHPVHAVRDTLQPAEHVPPSRGGGAAGAGASQGVTQPADDGPIEIRCSPASTTLEAWLCPGPELDAAAHAANLARQAVGQSFVARECYSLRVMSHYERLPSPTRGAARGEAVAAGSSGGSSGPAGSAPRLPVAVLPGKLQVPATPAGPEADDGLTGMSPQHPDGRSPKSVLRSHSALDVSEGFSFLPAMPAEQHEHRSTHSTPRSYPVLPPSAGPSVASLRAGLFTLSPRGSPRSPWLSPPAPQQQQQQQRSLAAASSPGKGRGSAPQLAQQQLQQHGQSSQRWKRHSTTALEVRALTPDALADRPSSLSHLEHFSAWLVSCNVPEKRLFGRSISGPMLARLVFVYHGLMSRGVPEPSAQHCMESVMGQGCCQAGRVAWKGYRRAMKDARDAISQTKALRMHKAAWAGARRSYLDATVHMDTRLTHAYFRELKQNCEDHCQSLLAVVARHEAAMGQALGAPIVQLVNKLEEVLELAGETSEAEDVHSEDEGHHGSEDGRFFLPPLLQQKLGGPAVFGRSLGLLGLPAPAVPLRPQHTQQQLQPHPASATAGASSPFALATPALTPEPRPQPPLQPLLPPPQTQLRHGTASAASSPIPMPQPRLGRQITQGLKSGHGRGGWGGTRHTTDSPASFPEQQSQLQRHLQQQGSPSQLRRMGTPPALDLTDSRLQRSQRRSPIMPLASLAGRNGGGSGRSPRALAADGSEAAGDAAAPTNEKLQQLIMTWGGQGGEATPPRRRL